jgi:dTDP-4-amino-4,6-dideoxygalactose transaminase
VARFEEMLREFTGARHAIAVSSCTAALHLSLVSAGIGKGDEVITTTMTFPATVNAIIHSGARPMLVDCDAETQLIDLEAVERAMTPRTRAIMPVHLHGRVCDLDALADLASRNQMVIIEDAAHALEAEYRERRIGAISDLTCFSFYPTKNITTAEGGAVTTNDDELARRVRLYRYHGLNDDAWTRYADAGFRHYDVEVAGFKYNMTDLQAAIGIHQLPNAEVWLARREQIWRRYDEAFAGLNVVRPPPAPADMRHARHLYTLQISEDRCGISRDAFIAMMKRLGIGTGVHYIAVHLRTYYREAFGYKPPDFPNATAISETTVSIPLSPHLSEDDVKDVIEAVHAIVG